MKLYSLTMRHGGEKRVEFFYVLKVKYSWEYSVESEHVEFDVI